jgi:predicted O-methyltransferase YrrM
MGGSLTDEEILNVLERSPGLKYFVETGTYKGDSSARSAKYFDKVYTMEINQSRYQESTLRFLSEGTLQTKVCPLLGDSLKLLPDIIEKVRSDRVLYFLDAHQSGDDTGNNGKWVPLYEELDLIIPSLVSGSVIIVDDIRLFDAHWDWSGITVENTLKKFGIGNLTVKSHYVAEDRLYIYV